MLKSVGKLSSTIDSVLNSWCTKENLSKNLFKIYIFKTESVLWTWEHYQESKVCTAGGAREREGQRDVELGQGEYDTSKMLNNNTVYNYLL